MSYSPRPNPQFICKVLCSLTFPRIAILCRGGRHSLPQPRRNLHRSQRLKLHFLTFLVFEGKSVWGWLRSHTIWASESTISNSSFLPLFFLLFLPAVPSPSLQDLPPALVFQFFILSIATETPKSSNPPEKGSIGTTPYRHRNKDSGQT